MLNNVKLFDFSIQHPEDVYSHHEETGGLIIPEQKGRTNALLKAHRSVLEYITAYKVALVSGNEKMKEEIVEAVVKILSEKLEGIRYLEFVRFWPTKGITYSIFHHLEHRQKHSIIRDMIELFINERHGIYSSYGYSPTTLQVGKDADAHKSTGRTGTKKIALMLEEEGFELNNTNLTSFYGGHHLYFFPEQAKEFFKKILASRSIRFRWSGDYQGKNPDCSFIIRGELFILEHKTKKEGGGGQSGQLVEVIDFIKQKGDPAHYVSFVDGAYFNQFKDKKSGKVAEQVLQILEALKKNHGNYFVNTAGFRKLIREY